MTALLILVTLLGCALLFYFIYTHERRPHRPLDPEAEAKAAVELHRIRRNLDVSFVKREQRRDAERVRRNIAEALEDDSP